MNAGNKLEYYMNLNYTYLSQKKGDSYIFVIPELQIISKANTLTEAYEKIEREKENYFEKVIEIEAYDIVNKPKKYYSDKSFTGVKNFTGFKFKLKYFQTIFFLLFFMSITYFIVLPATTFFMKEIVSKASYSIIQMVELRISQHVKKYSIMSEEEQTRIKAKIRIYVQQIKPIMDEITVLLDNNTVFKDKDTDSKKIP